MPDDKPIILLTGAAGAIGRAAAAALGARYHLCGFDRQCNKADFECVEADITDPDSLSRALGEVRERHGGRIASVIHLAAYYDFSGEPNPLYDEVNVRGTERLLAALEDVEVEQFVYASTILVHRPTVPGRPIDEDWPLEPKWAYPESKVAAEQVVRRDHGAIPYVILRIAGMYDDECHSPTLAHQIQRIYERKLLSHVFSGNTSHGQSFVHLADLLDALVRTVDVRARLPAETTLLIGEPGVMSYAALQLELARLIHGEEGWETLALPKTMAKTGAWTQEKLEKVTPDAIDHGERPFIKPFMIDLADDHLEIDIARAQRLLGWSPKHSLRETLPAMVRALKADPLGFYRKNKLIPPAWMEDAEALGEMPPSTARPPAAEKPLAQPERLRRRYEAVEHREHRATLWTHFVNLALGTWLIASPMGLGYADQTALAASDFVSGALICLFSLLSLSREMGWARWANAAVGTWLLFAPLATWTPSAAAYLNDTLVGTFVIVLAVLIAPPPGRAITVVDGGPEVPPGWAYNPSAWSQRIPIIALALFGFYIGRYLAAYQLGHIGAAWDPFFGHGTERIITSSVSRAWPVPDAGLGALTYMLEALSGALGDRRRWRTMPWMVVGFGILVVPLGGVSIFFIIIQPIWIGTWCSLCLIAAVAMVVMIPYSLDEIIATCQFMAERRRAGRPFWRTFFHGDTVEGGRGAEGDEFELPARRFLGEMVKGGVTLTWPLAVSVAIGVFLMLTRLVLGTEGAMADSDHVVGALVITVAATAAAEPARAARYINVLFGAWLVAAPALLEGASTLAAAVSVLLGLALVALSLPRGPIRYRYGSWDRFVR